MHKREEEPSFGEYIRRQRELQKLSMRQLAELVGISNPYLSQIERGLREPSERSSTRSRATSRCPRRRSTTRRARAAAEERPEEPAVVAAIRADRKLTARSAAALEIYDRFRGAEG